MLQRWLSPFSRLSHNTVSLLVLGLLIFWRIPFLAGIATFWENARIWAYFVYIAATYLLTAFLIWWERDRLRDFWIDLLGAIVVLCQWYMFPFGIGLFVAMRRSKARFPSPPTGLLRWGADRGAVGYPGLDLYDPDAALPLPGAGRRLSRAGIPVRRGADSNDQRRRI